MRTMKPWSIKRAWPLFLFLSLFAGEAAAAVCTSLSAGDWNVIGRWSCGHIPVAADTVVIAHNAVRMRNNYTVAGVTINAGAVLNDDGNDLTVNGNVVINGQLGINQGGALRMRTAGATLSGTGIVKDLTIEIDAANISIPAGSTLDFDPNAEIDVGANLAGSLTISGTVTAATQAAGDRVIRVSTGGTLTVGSTGVVDAPNSRLEVRNGATATNNGTITVRDLRGRTGTPTPVFTQGVNSTLNVSVALCAAANPCTFNASATGNTVNYNGAAQTVYSPVGATYANLTLSGSGSTTLPTGLTVEGNFTMSSTATTTAPVALTVGGNFSIGAGNTFTPGTGTVTLNGAAAQIISSANPVNFNNLTVTNGASPNITLATNVTVTGALTGSVTLTSTCPTDYTLTYNGGATVTHSCPPTVVVNSINLANPSPTSAPTVSWTVTFSIGVTGVDATAFALAASGMSGAYITAVTGGGTTWTVTANTGIGAGTLGLDQTGPGSVVPTLTGTLTGQVYTITSTPPLADYRMDEALWTGSANEVADSSGNANHAQALNSASTTDGSRAIAGNPGTCRYGVFDNGGTITQGYVQTPLPNLTTDFTIAAWIRSTNNAIAGQRILIDDNNNTTGYGFSLGDGAAGRLRFFSRGVTPVIFDSTYTIASNTWYFVAAVANITNQKRTLYVFDSSGALLASDAEGAAWTGTWGSDAGPVSIGAETNSSGELPATYHFHGNLDEVRVYQKVLSQNALAAIATQTHACPMPDHYELSLPSASISCLPSTVTVTACADSSSPCSNPSPNVTNETATLGTSAGTLGATTVTFNAGGIATTTLSHPAAGNGDPATVTLSGESYAATNARQCCPDGTSCVVANSCATTFSTAGFVVSASAGGGVATIPAQVAGTASAQYYLRAVKTSTTTKACESALAGANTINFAYECNNPTSCWTSNLMSVNGGSATTIARNNNGSVSSYTSVGMTFDVDGNAPFTFNYSDVGLVTLHVAKTVNSAPLSGSSNAFVVKPGGFLLSAIPGNPAAADANGATFVKAGATFSATVTATTSDGVTAAPNYGKETAAEGVKLTANLVAPSGGASPALQNATAFGAFTNGIATGTTFAWNEVGIVTLTPSVGDANYLGVGDVTGTATGNVGRFYPDHFETTVTTAPMSCGALSFTPACPSGSHLAYSGQSFTLGVTAYTLGGTSGVGITSNYSATESFAKAVTLTAWDDIGSTTLQNPPASGGALTGNSVPAASFTSFTGVASASPVYTYTASPTAPTNVYFRAIDTDSASSLNAIPANSVEGGLKVVSGRLQIENMYGPPPSRLGAKARALYWNGTQWALNSRDTASGAATGNFSFGDTSTCVTPTFCGITLSSAAALPGADGEFRLVLTPPTSGSDRRSVLLNSTLSYLAGSGRETWGSFRAPYIYQRER
ncbi:MAG: LamG domain-containing protein [Sulfuritalea sp.]|nr:LamG domain-containing protein [Sulfuritalea sp.]